MIIIHDSLPRRSKCLEHSTSLSPRPDGGAMSNSDGEVSFHSRLADCFEESPPQTQVVPLVFITTRLSTKTKEGQQENEIDLESWHNNDNDDFDDYLNNGQVECTTYGDEFNNDDALSLLDFEVNRTCEMCWLVTYDAVNKKFSLFDENNVLLNVPSGSIQSKLKTGEIYVSYCEKDDFTHEVDIHCGIKSRKSGGRAQVTEYKRLQTINSNYILSSQKRDGIPRDVRDFLLIYLKYLSPLIQPSSTSRIHKFMAH
eukprot:scaffold515_cov54-Attheya_sp.AAC.2